MTFDPGRALGVSRKVEVLVPDLVTFDLRVLGMSRKVEVLVPDLVTL